MQNLIIRITQENINILNCKEYRCFILAENLSFDFMESFICKAHQLNKLVLIADAAEIYLKLKADGIVIDCSKDEKPQIVVKALKQKMPQAIIGVISRNRRHEAMIISECEPDFIIFNVWHDGFEHTKELIGWYNELFLIQCAAQINEEVNYKLLPCDFVILDDKKTLQN